MTGIEICFPDRYDVHKIQNSGIFGACFDLVYTDEWPRTALLCESFSATV